MNVAGYLPGNGILETSKARGGGGLGDILELGSRQVYQMALKRINQ